MSMPVRNDLTTEEREIAARLARLGNPAGPSPAIDARILATARTAAGARPRHAPRWPLAFGLAASLVLVAGIAWRMLPQPRSDSGSIPRKQARSAGASRSPAPTEAPVAANVSDQQASGEAAGQPTDRAASDHVSTRPMSAAPKSVAPEAIEAPQVFEAPSPMSQPQPAPPPPTPTMASDSASTEATAGAAQAPAPAAPARAADEAARASAFPSAVEQDREQSASDEPYDAMPPATADAPEVRDAWLLRIRALIDAGDIAAGRASLRAFTQRYPDYPLPEDLRALVR